MQPEAREFADPFDRRTVQLTEPRVAIAWACRRAGRQGGDPPSLTPADAVVAQLLEAAPEVRPAIERTCPS